MNDDKSKDEKKLKKYRSAYLLYSAVRRPEIKNERPDIKSSKEVTKLIAHEWNKMTDKAKAKYKELEKEEKLKFEAIKQAEGIVYKYKTFKLVKKPLRRRTPYMFFVSDKKDSFKSNSNSENMSSLSKLWKIMSKDEKGPFVQKSNEDKERFEKEWAAYVQTFFQLQPKKKSKIEKKSDNQLIELFKKSSNQKKVNTKLNDEIKDVIKGRHVSTNNIEMPKKVNFAVNNSNKTATKHIKEGEDSYLHIKTQRNDSIIDLFKSNQIKKELNLNLMEMDREDDEYEGNLDQEDEDDIDDYEEDDNDDINDIFGKNTKRGLEAYLEMQQMSKHGEISSNEDDDEMSD
jgi:hypothetical protein